MGIRPGTPAALIALAAAGASLVAVSDDFGTNWDEAQNRTFGLEALAQAERYLTTGQSAQPSQHAYHGTAYELALVLLEHALGHDEGRLADLYRMRHRVTALVHLLGAAFVFLFARGVFRSAGVGLFAAALYGLHPLFVGHAFGNTSDIAFATLTAAGLNTAERFVRRRTSGALVAHACCTALAIDVRIVAVLSVPLTLLWIFAHDRARNRAVRGSLRVALLWAGCTWAFVVAAWPFLWGDAVYNFVWALVSAGRIPYHDTMMYLGQRISAQAVPWHYNLVWIGVTTPLPILALFGAGLVTTTVDLIHNPGRLGARAAPLLLAAAWFIVPLGAPVILGSVLFDSWRHHFFVYPSLVVFAAAAAARLVTWARVHGARRGTALVRLAAWLVVLHLAVTTVRLHPHQNVYFNPLARLAPNAAPKLGLVGAFDVDYWGTSYRQGLAYVAATTSGPVHIFDTSWPLRLNTMWLAQEDRARLRFVKNFADADTFLSTYRYHAREYDDVRHGTEVFSIWRDGTKILTVRRRPMSTVLPD